ncbi:hypothetical protein [Deinococcus multiflagellatus]|uniref:hypothetical protein n=1 Tax=Deinococcus multiflagellatus TaxID=1656887 RepID=UPI001CCAD1F8|nr:hypothetical protein [Deinococcus multiflagellatus]MBZ9712626.1 hypothetical protein [Deinococcus multiflagellatus]
MNDPAADAPTTPPVPPRRLPRWAALTLAGLAGAVTVNLLNEGVRRVLPHAPRMEVIGERALSASLLALGQDPPRGRALYATTLAADLASNTIYYALAGLGGAARAPALGTALGVAAGVGGATLPPRLGLGHQPHERPQTLLLTTAWYALGGVVAGAVYRRIGGE